MKTLIVYSKQHCGACKLVTTLLDNMQIEYKEVFDHFEQASPTIKIENTGLILFPPITGTKLKQFINQYVKTKRGV